MIAVILAGGYARRLWPLTLDTPKPLLPLDGKKVLDRIMEKVVELGPRVSESIILTNRKFERAFVEWSRGASHGSIRVLNDGSTEEGRKPGAVGALAKIADVIDTDFLVLAGDSLFLDPLQGALSFFDQRRAPVVCLYRPRSVDQLLRGSAVRIDSQNVVTEFTEKPSMADSDLVAAVMYFFPAETASRLIEYSGLGLPKDEPGRFLEWLVKKERVYGHLLRHDVLDIGTREAYALAKSGLWEP